MFAQVFAVATLALATLSNAAALPKRAVTVDPGKVSESAKDEIEELALDTTPEVVTPQYRRRKQLMYAQCIQNLMIGLFILNC